MTRRPKILASTALGLLIASAPLGATLSSAAFGAARFVASAPPILIKLKCKEGESAEACALRQQAPSENAAPLPATEPQPTPKPQAQPKEAAPASEAAPVPESTPPAEPSTKKQPAPTAEPAPAPPAEPAPNRAPDKSAPGKQVQPPADKAPLPTPAPQAPAPTDQPAPAQGEQPAEPTSKSEKKPATSQPAAEAPASKQPVTKAQPSTEQPPASGKPAVGEPAAPAQGEKPVQGEAPTDPNAAPILDSQKDAKRPGKDGKQPAQQGGSDQGAAPAPAAVAKGPPPADDKAAQEAIKPEKIVPVTDEKGKRLDKAPDVQAKERPQGADVKTEGDRLIIQFNNQTIVESNETPRLDRGAKDVYYEELPRGRTRETIVRDNGNQIVTIRNSNGDVIQRSRITPDGREYVLSYVDEHYYQDVHDWRDPGDDLPPMQLTIPSDQYILDSESVQDQGDYYTFLEQPPVEKVQRLYSVVEVKRSARVRDIARRVDLDTLNFESGSASISDSEVKKLQGVADAMNRLLKKNPAETFLIEGHTDAVGSENANLALSDRRAEAVAEALTSAFGIPPENLTTQGYGKRYLKVNTTGPERQNRRVAIRRITPLVAPVASAN
ncbi:OmpA family protein (plasmid) [Mesorhizobium sp. AR02]|nr:OmpA family protein [Mesorhizobium sp. AR02]